MKDYASYIKENLEIDNPFKEYPIDVIPTYFKYEQELETKLKEYYDKFIGRKVTIEGYYERNGKKEFGDFTFIVRSVRFKRSGQAMVIFFSNGIKEYYVRKILASYSTKKGIATAEDPYGEEDWEKDPILNEEVGNSEFAVGDRVRYVHKDRIATGLRSLDGICGTIKGRRVSSGSYAVEFDKSFGAGHSCDDLCIYGKGRWIQPDLLELEEPLEKSKIKWYYKGKLEERVGNIKVFEIDNGEITGKSIYLTEEECYKLEVKGYIGYEYDYDSGRGFFYYKLDDLYDIDSELGRLRRESTKNGGKIRWYHKGKLVENKLNEQLANVGDKVKIRDDSMYKSQAYDNGGDGYGFIIETRDPEFYYFCYTIRWNNGDENSYKEDDVDIIGEEEELKNVRWYYKGKLE